MKGYYSKGKYVQADFVRVTIDDGGHAEVTGIDGILADLQFEITPVIELRPKFKHLVYVCEQRYKSSDHCNSRLA